MQTISWSSATPGRRHSKSRRDLPTGWRPGAWRSTRTRRASSPSRRASTSWDSTSAGTAGKPLIKPSKAAARRIRERLRTELRSLRGSNAQAVIRRLNPIIRGWAAYYRTQVSAEIFGKLDQYLWGLTYKWARFSHSNKSTRWVVARYFGRFNKNRQDRWVFGDRKSGAYLHHFAWTNIVRHQIVSGAASPDDPALSRVLGHGGGTRAPCRSTGPPVAPQSPGRSMPDLQGALCPRRPATNPTRVGTLAGDHPQDDRTSHGTGTPDTAEPRLIHVRLPHNRGTGTATRQAAIRACLSRMLGNGHVRF